MCLNSQLFTVYHTLSHYMLPNNMANVVLFLQSTVYMNEQCSYDLPSHNQWTFSSCSICSQSLYLVLKLYICLCLDQHLNHIYMTLSWCIIQCCHALLFMKGKWDAEIETPVRVWRIVLYIISEIHNECQYMYIHVHGYKSAMVKTIHKCMFIIGFANIAVLQT